MNDTPDGTFRDRVLEYEIDAEIAIERLFNHGMVVQDAGRDQLTICKQALNAAVAQILQAASEPA